MQVETFILLIALFPGPTNTTGDVYIFENPIFPQKEFCEEYVDQNFEQLNIFLSRQYNTMPYIYASEYHCLTKDEFYEKFDKSNKAISI